MATGEHMGTEPCQYHDNGSAAALGRGRAQSTRTWTCAIQRRVPFCDLREAAKLQAANHRGWICVHDVSRKDAQWSRTQCMADRRMHHMTLDMHDTHDGQWSSRTRRSMCVSAYSSTRWLSSSHEGGTRTEYTWPKQCTAAAGRLDVKAAVGPSRSRCILQQ